MNVIGYPDERSFTNGVWANGEVLLAGAFWFAALLMVTPGVTAADGVQPVTPPSASLATVTCVSENGERHYRTSA